MLNLGEQCYSYLSSTAVVPSIRRGHSQPVHRRDLHVKPFHKKHGYLAHNNHYFTERLRPGWISSVASAGSMLLKRVCFESRLRCLPAAWMWLVMGVVIPKLKTLNQVWMWKHGIADRKERQKIFPSSMLEVLTLNYMKETTVKPLCWVQLSLIVVFCCCRSLEAEELVIWGGLNVVCMWSLHLLASGGAWVSPPLSNGIEGKKKERQNTNSYFMSIIKGLGFLYCKQMKLFCTVVSVCFLRELTSFGPKVSFAFKT